jgi:hypothetical protein
MTVPRSLASLIAALLVFALAGSGWAAERSYWRHKKGHFENIRGNRWVEKTPDATYRFVETKRTDRVVELYDRSRECTVRLFKTFCTVKFGNGRFQRLYEGKWGGR